MSAEPFIDNPGWSDVQPILDGLPVFTLANEDEKPLQYEVNGKPMAIFYADVAAAKQQFDAVTEQNPDLGYDLTPVGVGTACTSCPARSDSCARRHRADGSRHARACLQWKTEAPSVCVHGDQT